MAFQLEGHPHDKLITCSSIGGFGPTSTKMEYALWKRLSCFILPGAGSLICYEMLLREIPRTDPGGLLDC